jgi:hypothetical protein
VGAIDHGLDTFLRDCGKDCWAFITAHNPESVLVDADTNASRHKHLEQLLSSAEYRYYPGTGVGIGSEWPAEERAYS